MKSIVVGLVGVLLLASLVAPVSGVVQEAEADTVAVLFDFGNGQVYWVDVEIWEGMNAFNATMEAADALGLEVTSSNWGTPSDPNMFIDTIEGIGFNADTFEYWGFWTWDSNSDSWVSSMVGASDVLANSTDAIAMYYSASFTIGPLATPEHRYPWASFRHDAFNTGNRQDLAPNNITALWSEDLGNGAIDCSIVGANGMIYVKTGGQLNATTWVQETEATIVALDSSGVVWSAEIGMGYQVGTPLLYAGMIIVPSADGKVYAFDAEDGEELWSFDTGSGSGYGVVSSPIMYQDQILVGAGNGKLFSISTFGLENWNKTIASVIYSSSPAAKDGVVYIGADDGKLHAVASNGSAELWSLALSTKVRGSPILLDDMILVTFVNSSAGTGGLAAVNYDGELIWKVATASSPASATLTSVGIVMTTAEGLFMFGLDGSKLWNVSVASDFAPAAAASVDDTIFMVTNEAQSKVVAISAWGAVYWEYALSPSNYALSAPTIIDDFLYVTSDNGYVYAFMLDSVLPTGKGVTIDPEGLVVSFSVDAHPDDCLYYYTWDFGDGNTSVGAAVNHTYAEAGDYNVTLTISNPAGQTQVTSYSVSLEAAEVSSGLPSWTWIAVLVVIVVAAFAAVFLMRRKK